MSIYCHDRPVAGVGSYVGREILIRSLLSGIEKSRGFVLLGGPRTGRTSTLQHVAGLLRERWTRNPSNLKVVPVLIDLEPLRGTSIQKMLAEIWDTMTREICRPEVFGGEAPVEPPKLSFGKDSTPWQAFAEASKEFWQRMQRTSGWCRYTLFLDNADALTTYELEESHEPFAQFIASSESWSPQGMVIACGRLLRESVWDHHSPLNGLRPLLLGTLRDSEAEALVRVGFPELEETTVQSLLAASGKHPYLLQRMLAELEGRGIETSPAAITLAVDPEAVTLCEALWAQFDLERGVTYRGAYAAPEHALMQAMLEAGVEITLKQAERDLGIKPLKEYMELLEYLGVAERLIKNDGVFFRPPSDIWNAWYRQRIAM